MDAPKEINWPITSGFALAAAIDAAVEVAARAFLPSELWALAPLALDALRLGVASTISVSMPADVPGSRTYSDRHRTFVSPCSVVNTSHVHTQIRRSIPAVKILAGPGIHRIFVCDLGM